MSSCNPPVKALWDNKAARCQTDMKYRGEPYSLKILWSTKQHAWEPLSQFFEDEHGRAEPFLGVRPKSG